MAKAVSWRKHRLTYYRWEWQDPVQERYWTAVTISVYAPTYERPYPSVLVSIANGGGRILFRCQSIEAAKKRLIIPEVGLERLENAYRVGQELEIAIKKDLALLYTAGTLPQGAGLARTDTGEIVSERGAVEQAERIVDRR